jgi:hypothetical protein
LPDGDVAFIRGEYKPVEEKVIDDGNDGENAEETE